MNPINWSKIELFQRKAFTGGTLTEAEQAMVQEAYEADPVKYGEQQFKVVKSEAERLMGFDDE